jgi:hypothetical protein
MGKHARGGLWEVNNFVAAKKFHGPIRMAESLSFHYP